MTRRRRRLIGGQSVTVAKRVQMGSVLVLCLALGSEGTASRVFASEQGTMTVQTVSFGMLTPTASGAPRTVAIPVRLSMPSTRALRYRVSAIASFVFTPAAPALRGKTMTASDIGVGITGVSSVAQARPSKRTVIAAAFDYDPATVTRLDRAAPFTGTATERATLADLLAGRELLRGEKSVGGRAPPGADDVILTITLGILSQFVTPGSFSGTITLTVSDVV